MIKRFEDLSNEEKVELHKVLQEWLESLKTLLKEVSDFMLEWLACLGQFLKEVAEKERRT